MLYEDNITLPYEDIVGCAIMYPYVFTKLYSYPKYIVSTDPIKSYANLDGEFGGAYSDYITY